MSRALIVEDEPLLRAELRDQLQLLWPSLQIAGEAGDGIAALALITEQQPDIVFLDIQMPGLNGLEVAQHLPAGCQVVFVTAYAEYALSAFDAGAVDYLVKPLATVRLLQMIRRLQARGQRWRRKLDPSEPEGIAGATGPGAVCADPSQQHRQPACDRTHRQRWYGDVYPSEGRTWLTLCQ